LADLVINGIISDIEKRFMYSSWLIPQIISYNDGDFNSYGFVRFIKYNGALKNVSEVKQLYLQYGKLLGYGQVFKIADGHADNIIINYPHISWVDLETAFHTFINAPTVAHPIEMTGLLFEATNQTCTLGIVTAIQAGKIPRVRLTRPTILNDGTDEISIRYFGLVNSHSTHSQIKLLDKICKPEDYITEIQEGYAAVINCLLKHKEYFVSQINKGFKATVINTRFLCLVTACYSRYIALIQHPQSSGKNILNLIKEERYTILSSLEDKKKDFIVENELMDLCNGVVPYFFRKSNSKALYHTSGASCQDFFESTVLEEVVNNINKLSCDDIESGKTFIKRALNSTAGINGWDGFIAKFDFPLYSKVE
jgi:lantibiotic modifying enzyme